MDCSLTRSRSVWKVKSGFARNVQKLEIWMNACMPSLEWQTNGQGHSYVPFQLHLQRTRKMNYWIHKINLIPGLHKDVGSSLTLWVAFWSAFGKQIFLSVQANTWKKNFSDKFYLGIIFMIILRTDIRLSHVFFNSYLTRQIIESISPNR